mmetsp:Transcript_20393/g.47902  ORF Transcript_20393/g.47902 Transcript_20393/m.47902 type:complete len:229 (+) Transcript_20393:3049-3735(+)
MDPGNARFRRCGRRDRELRVPEMPARQRRRQAPNHGHPGRVDLRVVAGTVRGVEGRNRQQGTAHGFRLRSGAVGRGSAPRRRQERGSSFRRREARQEGEEEEEQEQGFRRRRRRERVVSRSGDRSRRGARTTRELARSRPVRPRRTEEEVGRRAYPGCGSRIHPVRRTGPESRSDARPGRRTEPNLDAGQDGRTRNERRPRKRGTPRSRCGTRRSRSVAGRARAPRRG